MKQQISQVLCNNNKHKKAPIDGICFNPQCKKKDFFCGVCLTESHSTHLNECRGLDEVEDLVQNSKRIQELVTIFEAFSVQTTSRLYKIRQLLKSHVCDLSPINGIPDLQKFSATLKQAARQPKFNIQKVDSIVRNISELINQIIQELNQQEQQFQPINFTFEEDVQAQKFKLSEDGKHLIIKDKESVYCKITPPIYNIEQPEFTFDFNIINNKTPGYMLLGLGKIDSADYISVDQYGKIASTMQKLFRGDVEDGDLARSIQDGDTVRFTVDKLQQQVRVSYLRQGTTWIFNNVNSDACQFFARFTGEIAIS